MEQRIGFMSKRLGNVTLGEINEMLISFIGKDVYLAYRGKVKDEAYDKNLRRLFKEDDKVDLSILSLSDEKSISKFVFETILPDLRKNYSLSDGLCDFMKNFVQSLYYRFTHNDWPILDYCSNFDLFHIQDYLEQAKQKYDLAFEKIRERYKSLENFYVSFENDGTIKNSVNAIRGHAKNPTWCNLEKILNQVKNDQQITGLLIDAFILSNIYISMHDKVKTNLIIDIQYNAINSINNGIQYFFVDYGYKNDKSRANVILKTIEEQCPEAAEFYCNWFRGYHYVAKGELNQAKDCYKKAFAARRFAGCQFETFIKQAIALSCYLDFNADKVRDSADQAKHSQSPLPADAKKFWNYCYAAGVFEQKMKETHLIVFRRVENLLISFGSKMFYEDSVFYVELLMQLFNDLPKDKKIYKDGYDILSSLKVNDINRRIRFVGARQTKNLPIVMALFCVGGCYSFGYADLAGKFIALIKSWLANVDIDFSLCSDKGCTIACDAIQQYKSLKLHKLELDLAEMKQIVMKIIEKSDSDSLTKKSLQKKRSALQEAIESCDIEIVKAVVEKIKDIDNLRISAAEESPVYYAINRYVLLYCYINDTIFKIQDGNINYKNLDVPGLIEDDKVRYIKVFESDIELAYKIIMYESYGRKELWSSELNDIQNICLYLIEQTKDQDGYYTKTKDGNCITSLLFAAESNNIEICRKLILHNADPNICRPYTFLHRCIHWESWDVLEMYLNEFPDKAKVGINDNLQEKSSLSTFLEKMENEYMDGREGFIMHIVDLLGKCDAYKFVMY